MKKLKLAVFTVAVMLSSLTFALNDNPTVEKELHSQIVSFLGKNIQIENEDNLKAVVSFTLNADSEIVILSVTSKSKTIESLVKSKLNYKKVTVKALNEGKVYKMPLSIVKR